VPPAEAGDADDAVAAVPELLLSELISESKDVAADGEAADAALVAATLAVEAVFAVTEEMVMVWRPFGFQ
jgi:hypothetical protein